MPSTIRGSDNFDTAGGHAVKAWVNFNGTGTVAIRASYNVSSITDNGTGDYTVNFTTAMPDANYCVSGAGGGTSGNFNTSVSVGNYLAAPSTTAVRVVTYYGTTISDCGQANVAIFR